MSEYLEPSPQPTVTVDELDTLIKSIFDLRNEIKGDEAKVTEKNKKLSELKGKAVATLKELGRKNFQAPDGTVTIKQVWRVGLPKETKDKQAFFAWMREKGIFDQYATVNSNSLNSLYSSEWESARRNGEGMDFRIPGIGEPTLFEDLGVRKATEKGESNE